MANKSKTKKVVKVDKVVKNDNKLMLYALVVLALTMVLYLAVKKTAMNKYSSMTPMKVDENTYPAMKNNSDLDKAVEDLDSNEVNNIDKELNGMDTDSSNF